MTTSEIIQTLYRGGGMLLPEGDALTVDAPKGLLTPALLEQIRRHKAELLATLANGHLCPRCGGALRIQDRQADAWYCAGCRKWCDGQGGPVAEIETVCPLTLEEVEARQLVADLLAAGCGFVLSEDGQHARVTNYSSVSTALWMRLEEATPEFKRLALAEAKVHEEVDEAGWVM